MLGAVGNLILFFFTLISAIIVGLFALTYAAHCFLTIVEDTAASNDEVRWPDEPPTDWYGKPFFVGWLLLAPIIPASLVILGSNVEILDTPLGKLGLILAAVWLFFPLCLWSSLGGSSKWLVVHFGMYRRVFRHPGVLGLFYLLTAPILVLGVALLYYGITSPNMVLLPVGAIGGTTLLFIYSRLVGRVAWLACQGLPPRKKKQKRLRDVASHDPWAESAGQAEQAPSEAIVDRGAGGSLASKGKTGGTAAPRSKSAAITAVDPWAAPDEPHLPPTFSSAELEVEEEWAPNKKPYGLASGGHKPPVDVGENKGLTPPTRQADDEDEWTPNKKPYALKDYVAESEEKTQPAARAMDADDEEDEWTPNKKPYGFQPEEEKPTPVAHAPGSPSRLPETRVTTKSPGGREERIQSVPSAADIPVDPHELPKPSRLDMQIYLEPYKPFVPRWTLFSGVWDFPLYAMSMRALVYLSAIAFVLGLLIRTLLLLWPF